VTDATDLPLFALQRRVQSPAAAEAVPTGFPSLDRLLGGGLRPGDLTVLTGDTASGKSSLALAMALRAAQLEHVAQFLSGEMTPARVLERALAIEGRVSVDQLRRGALDDATRLSLGGPLRELTVRAPLLEPLPATVEELAVAVRRADARLVVVDPLIALCPGARSRDEELATLVRQLKQLALESHTSIVVTLPLGEIGARPDPRPTLADIGALGAPRHEADVVLALFREEMYAQARGIEGATELHLLKNRNGGTGYVDLYFYAAYMRFEDMVDPDR
jgi:replicative DNA helicase